jgi:hypothetical protein
VAQATECVLEESRDSSIIGVGLLPDGMQSGNPQILTRRSEYGLEVQKVAYLRMVTCGSSNYPRIVAVYLHHHNMSFTLVPWPLFNHNNKLRAASQACFLPFMKYCVHKFS